MHLSSSTSQHFYTYQLIIGSQQRLLKSTGKLKEASLSYRTDSLIKIVFHIHIHFKHMQFFVYELDSFNIDSLNLSLSLSFKDEEFDGYRSC